MPEVLLRVLLITAALTIPCVLGIFLMRYARRGGKGFKAAGAMLMLFGWGNLRDPNNDTVAEARDGRIRKGTHSGDPLDDERR